MSVSIDAVPNDKDLQAEPWYRYGWPWFLISIPLVSVALGIMMLVLGLSANNSLVVDDYYKEGKGINLRIERDRLASLLGLSARVHATGDGLIIDVARQATVLPSTADAELREQAEQAERVFQWPATLTLRWVHVTRAELDAQVQLQSLGGDRYLATAARLPSDGRYRLHLQAPGDSAWRLVSDLSDLQTMSSVSLNARSLQVLFPRQMGTQSAH